MNQLGPYELLGVVGRGGMGTVYRARHNETGEIVAVKALGQNFGEDPHFRQRFESEIQALLKLDHPNIVRLIGYGEADGAMYFAMELVEGNSLFNIQREIKMFDWRDVLVICRDVASGLRHAHDRGIIHRDLKPGNLLKSTEGIIKITDFGIAKAYGVNHDTRDNVVGTIDYMSPEQALGRPVTHRSDLYSLGVVMFTLLAGQPPFASNSIEQSLRNLTRVAAPKIRSRVPNVPDALEDVIDELLEKKPDDRTPTAYALLRKLDYVEQVLRSDSEADTSHGGPQPGMKSGTAAGGPGSKSKPKSQPGQPPARSENGNGMLSPENTFRLGKPGEVNPPSASAKPVESGPATARQRGTVDLPHISPLAPVESGTARRSTQTGNETVIQTDIPIEPIRELPEQRADYFNPVTDETRRKVYQTSEDVEVTRAGGWIPTLLLFVLVLAMGGYGVWQATRPESPQVLYERIAENANEPHRALDHIKTFLLNYPNDARAARVRELNDIAMAVQTFKRLNARQNTGGHLSMLERDFVMAVDEAESDPSSKMNQLESFIVLHDRGEETPAETIELVSAASYYLKKIKNDSAYEQAEDLRNVRNAIDRASALPLGEAIEVYKSVINLYADKEWVSRYVEEAREKLVDAEARLKQEKAGNFQRELQKERDKAESENKAEESAGKSTDSGS